MPVAPYKYTVQQCDIPASRHALLQEYRDFRPACLGTLNGSTPTSVTNQVHDLTWYTAVFRTLNEARRLEPARDINSAMWDLITAGYAQLMILGIRRLVDHDDRTDSLWVVIDRVEKRPELLSRELFVCYDGIPFDPTPGHQAHLKSIAPGEQPLVARLSMTGPEAWGASEIMHRAFDKWLGPIAKRRRLDHIPVELLSKLKSRLNNSAIKTIKTIADRNVAHAERRVSDTGPHLEATYNDINEALAEIVRISNYVSGHIFYDQTFGSVVATPQFDVLKALDQPWVTATNIPLLHKHWNKVIDEMDGWLEMPFDPS